MMFVGYGASDTGTRNWREMGLIISCKYNDSNIYMNTSTQSIPDICHYFYTSQIFGE